MTVVGSLELSPQQQQQQQQLQQQSLQQQQQQPPHQELSPHYLTDPLETDRLIGRVLAGVLHVIINFINVTTFECTRRMFCNTTYVYAYAAFMDCIAKYEH